MRTTSLQSFLRFGAASPAALAPLCLAAILLASVSADAQFVDDGSDAAIGTADAQKILELIGRNLKDSSDAKVTSLRRSEGSVICGSVNVKNQDGLYLGERGFVVDLVTASFGRVPEGPELLSSRAEGFEEKERVRQLYFRFCLD